MAWTASFTIKRGQGTLKGITRGAGVAEAQRDTMSLNIDTNLMTKGDALIMLDQLVQKIHAGKWPPA